MDLENFATASRRYTGDIHKSSVVGLFMTHLRQWKRLGRVMVECTLSITHCLRLNLQLHTIDLVSTCRISSFCTVAWQLARFQLTRRIARSLGDSWASCTLYSASGEKIYCNFPNCQISLIQEAQCHPEGVSIASPILKMWSGLYELTSISIRRWTRATWTHIVL